MSVVWKFPFKVSERFTQLMPDTSTILKIDLREGQPTIWALVHDPDAPTVERTFQCVATGHEFDAHGLQHRATLQLDGGVFVFHVFEEMPLLPSGRALDDATIEALAAEAAEGYDVEKFVRREQP